MGTVRRRDFISGAPAVLLTRAFAQEPVFVCPMDPEVRAAKPGKCPRCGMTLVPGIPEPLAYPMEFRAKPRAIPAGQEVTLEFRILDPKTGKPVARFETVHEKLFHLFVVSQDLEFFAHLHPEFAGDGWFRLRTTLPKAGTYRLLADFYPEGGTPQLGAKTFSTAGFVAPLESSMARPAADIAPKHGVNVEVGLKTDPWPPLAGKKTMLFFSVDPADGLEQYIGAWGHLLAVSNDLVDAIHSHPFLADGGPRMQFNLFLPRPAIYRLWLQIQRKGVVNTVAFTLQAAELK